MQEQQLIDTSDIDILVQKKREDAMQQLYKEIVQHVDTLVKSGQISSNQRSNGLVTKYVSFNVSDMPGFRRVFPFGEGANICNSVSPAFKRQTQEAINRLKQLCIDKKIEINTGYAYNQMMARYFIEKEDIR